MIDTGTMLLLMLLAGIVMTTTKASRIWAEYRAFKAWRADGRPTGEHAEDGRSSFSANPSDTSSMPSLVYHPTHGITLPTGADLARLDTRIAPNAGQALLHPPGDLRWTLAYIREHYGHRYGRYTVPLGWRQSPSERAELVVGHLVDDINMTQLTAMTDGGKDNYILTWLFTLTTMYTPDHLQIVIVDGKGGKDYIGWEHKAHILRLAQEEEDIKPTMEFLTRLRKRRNRFLRDVARKSKWDEYRGDQGPMPLVLVVISDLSLMEDAVKKSELYQWLSLEVKGARSDGIRYLVCTQDTSGESTSWRNQMGLRICGFQATSHADRPNTGLTPSEIEERGGVPPSKLPYPKACPGLFTIVQGHDVVTVRTSHITDAQREMWLSVLPEREHVVSEDESMILDALLEQSVDVDRSDHEEREINVREPVPAPQPVAVAAAQTTPTVSDLLETLTHRELREHPLFIQTCVTLYKKHTTYRGVILDLWGEYTGSREQTVKAAIENAAEQKRDAAGPIPTLANAA